MTIEEDMKDRTIDEALIDIQKIIDKNDWDFEGSHWEADMILCGFLNHLGYGRLVEKYHQVGKWYA